MRWAARRAWSSVATMLIAVRGRLSPMKKEPIARARSDLQTSTKPHIKRGSISRFQTRRAAASCDTTRSTSTTATWGLPRSRAMRLNSSSERRAPPTSCT
jgi:hypothetical protein